MTSRLLKFPTLFKIKYYLFLYLSRFSSPLAPNQQLLHLYTHEQDFVPLLRYTEMMKLKQIRHFWKFRHLVWFKASNPNQRFWHHGQCSLSVGGKINKYFKYIEFELPTWHPFGDLQWEGNSESRSRENCRLEMFIQESSGKSWDWWECSGREYQGKHRNLMINLKGFPNLGTEG